MVIRLKGPLGFWPLMEILLLHTALFSLSACPDWEEQAVLFVQGVLIFFLTLFFPFFSVHSWSHSALQLKPEKSCPAQSCQGNRIGKNGWGHRPLRISLLFSVLGSQKQEDPS